MIQPVYINANEFMEMLQANNLVIVKQEELVMMDEMKRQQLLKRKDLSFSQIIKAGFFDTKDASTLRNWCIAGKFGKDGFYQLKNKEYRILTTALKMVLYGK